MENVSACRFPPTDHGSICNSDILKYRVTTFRLDTLERPSDYFHSIVAKLCTTEHQSCQKPETLSVGQL